MYRCLIHRNDPIFNQKRASSVANRLVTKRPLLAAAAGLQVNVSADSDCGRLASEVGGGVFFLYFSPTIGPFNQFFLIFTYIIKNGTS